MCGQGSEWVGIAHASGEARVQQQRLQFGGEDERAVVEHGVVQRLLAERVAGQEQAPAAHLFLANLLKMKSRPA